MNGQRNILFALLLIVTTGAAYGQVEVFACEPEWASLARDLGGDRVRAYSATTGRQDVHHIEARPGLIARVRKADLLLCTGAGLEEGWLPVLLARSNNTRVRPGGAGYMEVSDAVELLDVRSSVSRADGHVHPQGNPHIQLDPRKIPAIAEAVSQRLAEVDPQGADGYAGRLRAFLGRWNGAMQRWDSRSKGIRGMRVVVHHDSWIYLADWLGLEQAGMLEVRPGVPPTSTHLSRLLGTLKKRPVEAIIRSPYQSERASGWLSDRSGTPALVLPTTVGGTDAVTDLFSLFDDILDRLLAVRS